MKKIIEFIDDKRYLIMGLVGVLLITMTFKTQSVIIKYSDDYAVKMDYTIYGYCIRARATLKAAEPAVYGDIYFGSSFNVSALKAVNQLEKLTDERHVVGVLVTGFPRDAQKLEKSIKEYLESNNKAVEIILS